MMSLILKNEASLKKWQRFKQRKLAVVSCWLFIIATFFSFTAEFWANSKPVLLHYNNEYHFPVFKDYHPTKFDQEETMVTDYKNLVLNKERGDYMIMPVIKWDPYESNAKVEYYPSEPTTDNWFGTDDRGRDILVRLLYGLRYSIIYAVLVWMITFIIGTALGGLMGFLGGRVDFWGQRIVEVFSTVPQFFLLIIVISIFKPSLWLLIIISSVFGWISISYYVRGEFLKNRKKEFVEAARAIGAGRIRIFGKHLLPNSLSPIITFSPFVIASNIVGLAGLDYLGFGLTPPIPSWGELLNQAQKYFMEGWWLAVYPSLALFLTLTMLSLIGEGVRDAMDPRD